jgi:hypothetical protein
MRSRSRRHPSGGRLACAVVAAALLALVIVPAAAAIRFTDDSYNVPSGVVGSPYGHQFKGDGGCGPALPYQFRILSGQLPPGLSLSTSGLVSGTPAEPGSWSFWLELSDQDPPSQSWCIPKQSQREFTIQIAPRGTTSAATAPAPSPRELAGILPVPNPCELPIVGNVCDAVSGAVTRVAQEAGDFVMRGVTAWVTNAAVWVTGKVGELIDHTASPDLTAGWFQGQYGTMVAVAGTLALLMLMLAVIQSVIHQDVGLLMRSAFGYLPIAFILAGVAIAATGLLIAITDDMASGVVGGLGTDQSSNLLQSVGDAYKNALDQTSGIPLFGVFLGAIILAIGAFVLWLELVIRDAAIYVCVFFLPLTFVAMIWPATSRWARRLVELLIAIVLAKFVIVAILSLASAALTNTSLVQGDGNTFERMIAGSALLVLAAWSPFALLRLIPMMEVAAATVGGQRAAIAGATAAVGVQTPAAYMRQAMSRSTRGTSSAGYASGGEQATATTGGSGTAQSGDGAGDGPRTPQPGWPSTTGGGAVDPAVGRPARQTSPGTEPSSTEEPASRPEPPSSAPTTRRASAGRDAEAPPGTPVPPPQTRQHPPRPPEPPRDPRPPTDGGET